MESPYGEPATDSPEAKNSIIINQKSPGLLLHPGMFKATSVVLNCTFCHKPITTSVTENIN